MLRLTLPTLLLAAATPGLAQDAEPTLPAFDPAAFADPAANPLWTLEQGQVRTYEAITPEGVHELEVVTVMGDGPVILDVQTTTVLDERHTRTAASSSGPSTTTPAIRTATSGTSART